MTGAPAEPCAPHPRSGADDSLSLVRAPFPAVRTRFRSLAHRIGILFVTFALLLIVLSFAFSYYIFHHELVASAETAMAVQTAEKAAAVLRWIRLQGRALELLATWSGFAQPPRAADGRPSAGFTTGLTAEFRRWQQGSEGAEYRSLMFLHPDTGAVEIALPPEDVGKVRRFRPYFQQGRLHTFVQNPFFSLRSGAVIMAVATPVKGEGGSLQGVLAAEIELGELDRIMGQASGTFASAQSYVVNAARMFVTQPSDLTDPVVLRRANFSPIVGACLEGGSGAMLARDHRMVQVVAAYRWLDAHGLCLISQVDRDEVLRGMQRLTLLLALTSVAALSIGTILAVFFARTLAAPIVAMARAARRFGEGDQAVRIAGPAGDELGDLADSFNAMAEALAARDARLRRSNQDLEQFAYVASHDLQEPLRKITAFGDLLIKEKAGQLDPDGGDYVHYMVDAARRMRILINDLLTYARVTTRGLPLQPVDLNAILTIVCEDLSLVLAESGGRLSIGPLPQVAADPGQMEQLFQNLLSNSLKYRQPDRAPEIAIAGAAAGGWAEITVTDQGIGFDPKAAEEIFQPFRRLHGRGQYEGTGMGLAICRRIVERHGGSIQAQAEPGRGSVFRVRLPLPDAGAAPAVPAPAAGPRAAGDA